MCLRPMQNLFHFFFISFYYMQNLHGASDVDTAKMTSKWGEGVGVCSNYTNIIIMLEFLCVDLHNQFDYIINQC